MKDVFQRKQWSTNDGITQHWVNEIIWSLLRGPRPGVDTPMALPGGMEKASDVCRQTILGNGLQGMVSVVFGDKLRPLLGNAFYDRIEIDRRRTELFYQEMHWLFGPKVSAPVIPISGATMRPYYRMYGREWANPRFIHLMNLWAPTLENRAEVERILLEGGYSKGRETDDGYLYSKSTMGIDHSIKIRGTLWESSKNWSLDIERDIWDRASPTDLPAILKVDATDNFIMTCRRYSIESIVGAAVDLLDLIVLLEQTGSSLDWDRIRELKTRFAKPDWLWAPILAISVFEGKTGRKVEIPEWARKEAEAYGENFWTAFIETRLNWANPDTRLVEYSRAYVKLTKGA